MDTSQHAPFCPPGGEAVRYANAVYNTPSTREEPQPPYLPKIQISELESLIEFARQDSMGQDFGFLNLPCIQMTMPDGSIGYLLNYNPDALPQPTALHPAPADSLMSSLESSWQCQETSIPSLEQELQRAQQPEKIKKKRSKSLQGKYKKAILPKPKKLYELDDSTIHDKKQKRRVQKAKTSKAYRDKVNLMAKSQCWCADLYRGDPELFELVRSHLAGPKINL